LPKHMGTLKMPKRTLGIFSRDTFFSILDLSVDKPR
jgi:hypothetical protein